MFFVKLKITHFLILLAAVMPFQNANSQTVMEADPIVAANTLCECSMVTKENEFMDAAGNYIKMMEPKASSHRHRKNILDMF